MDGFLTILLTEYESGVADAANVTRAAGVDLTSLAAALEPLVNVTPRFDGRVEFRASGAVGTLRVGGLRVDVRPRMAAAELATLIRYALGGRVAAIGRSAVAGHPRGFDDLIAGVFADELTRVRQVGLSRRYVERRQRVIALRGRPDFLASFPWDGERGTATLACRYHELSCDNLDNRLIAAALARAWSFDCAAATRAALSEHRRAWEDLIGSTRWSPGPEHFALSRQRYNRLSEHYRLAHGLAEMILLSRLRPGSPFEPVERSDVTGGLVVNVAGLFEGFVTEVLREAAEAMGLSIRSQSSDGGAVVDAGGRTYLRVRPDLTFLRGGSPVAVVDAKYKDYWRAADASGRPNRSVSPADLYQLFFYAQRLRVRYRLTAPPPPPAIIVAPVPDESERGGEGVIGVQFRRLSYRAGGGDAASHLHLALLPLAEWLRAAANGENLTPRAVAWLSPLLTNGRGPAPHVTAEIPY